MGAFKVAGQKGRWVEAPSGDRQAKGTKKGSKSSKEIKGGVGTLAGDHRPAFLGGPTRLSYPFRRCHKSNVRWTGLGLIFGSMDRDEIDRVDNTFNKNIKNRINNNYMKIFEKETLI